MSLRVVVMGVSGCGKSSVGAALGDIFGIPYRDGDTLHPPNNIAKMSAGVPLADDDRWPWLDLVSATLRAEAPVIVGCSALRRVYRDRIRGGAGGPVIFAHLDGPRDLIAARMADRTGHYMPPSLLDSQFAALEPPAGESDAITVAITHAPEDIAAFIAREVRKRGLQ